MLYFASYANCYDSRKAMIKWYIMITLLLLCPPLHARMYQWYSPGTGTAQLSGKPPAWYRSAQNGPRVIAFDNGRIVDDTAVAVSNEQREALRQQALREAEGYQERALEQARAAAKLKAAFESNIPEEEETETVAEISEPSEVEEIPATEADAAVTNSIEALKALISAWDQSRVERAKMIVESQDSETLSERQPDQPLSAAPH